MTGSSETKDLSVLLLVLIFFLYFFFAALGKAGMRLAPRIDLRNAAASLGIWQQRSPVRSAKAEGPLLRHTHLLSEIWLLMLR